MKKEILDKVILYSHKDLNKKFKEKLKKTGLTMSSWYRLKQQEFLDQ